MIETIEFNKKIYPKFQADGFAAQFAFPFAKHICKGIGFDIGCNREEWSFPGSIPIDLSFNNGFDAMELPYKVDYIFSSHCLEHLDSWIDAITYWVTDILNPGGNLFLYLPHKSQEYWLPWNNKKHKHIIHEEDVINLLNHLGMTNIFISGCDINNSYIIIAEKINTMSTITKNDITFIVDEYKWFWDTFDKWENETFNTLDKYLNKDKTIIDIGAWIGPISIYSSYKAKYCYSVEPDNIAHFNLIGNIKLNNIENILVNNIGISNEDGTIKLYTNDTFGNSMSSSVIDNPNLGVIEKKALTLDSFIIENDIDLSICNFIKMDTEGSEFSILSKAINIANKNRQITWLISFHPFLLTNVDFTEFIKFFNSFDFVYDVNFKEITYDYFLFLFESNKGFDLIFTNEN